MSCYLVPFLLFPHSISLEVWYSLIIQSLSNVAMHSLASAAKCIFVMHLVLDNILSQKIPQTTTKALFLDHDQNPVRTQVLTQKQRANFKRKSDTNNTKKSQSATKPIKLLKLNARNHILNNRLQDKLWDQF